MGTISFNTKELVSVGEEINSACVSTSDIKTSLESLKGHNFSFSPNTSSNILNVASKINTMVERLNNLNNSYQYSKQLLLDLIEDNKAQIDQDIATTKDSREIKNAIEFFFGYQNGEKGIRMITEEELRSIFERNGCKVYFNNAYEYEIDGMIYRYNVKSHKIENYVNGKLNGSMNCMFFISDDTTFEDITNTITVMCGTGTNRVPNSLEGMSINKNTMVAVGYGNDSSANMPHVVSGITRTCSYLSGHNTSNELNNSIVGYSLGGLAAFKTASNYPGLYKKIVTVNSASYSFDETRNFIDNYQNLAGIEIIMVEANRDKFGGAAIKTIRELKENGLGDNVSFYSNSDDFQARAREYLDQNQVHDIDDDFANSHEGWEGHGHGFEMLLGINIFNYLSEA